MELETQKYEELKKIIIENCEEISKNEYWNMYELGIKYAYDKRNYLKGCFENNGEKMFFHSLKVTTIISIGSKFYSCEDYDNLGVILENINAILGEFTY